MIERRCSLNERGERERREGDGVGGSRQVSTLRSYVTITYIYRSARSSRRGARGKGELSRGKHRVTTRGEEGNTGARSRAPARACIRFHKYFIGSSFDFIAPHDRMTRRIRRQLFSRYTRETRIIPIYSPR